MRLSVSVLGACGEMILGEREGEGDACNCQKLGDAHGEWKIAQAATVLPCLLLLLRAWKSDTNPPAATRGTPG